jgi:acyl carrier protein
MSTEKIIIEQMALAFGQDLSGQALADCTPGTVSGWDSMSFLNLVVLLEDAFKVSMEIDDIAKMATGGEAIAEVIKEKTGR